MQVVLTMFAVFCAVFFGGLNRFFYDWGGCGY